MPRPERPLDPAGGPVAEFAAELRLLRQAAGSPGYRQLARKAHFSAATLAAAAAGQRLPSLDVTLAFVAACAGDREEWSQRWRTVAAKIDATNFPAGDDVENASAPYLGLAAYQPEDAHLFFGRDRLIDDLVERLATRRFLAVFGPSGCGKSSLLRAGLMPAVRTRYSWRPLVFTPGARPLTELAARVEHLTGAAWHPGGPDSPGLPSLVEKAFADQAAQGRILFVIDQFEEVFTLCQDEGERARFVAALLALAHSEGDRIRVVIGVRADFYAACAGLRDLVAGLRDAQVLIGPMTSTELREAVVRPAERAGLMVEGALVSTIVAEMTGKDGGLPLLSHTLREVWRRRRGSALTQAGYEAAGGIQGALAQTAEALYARLVPRQQETLREILLRLVALGEGVEDTRRRANRTELDFPEAGCVLDRMAAERLVVLGEDTAEIAHEALIAAWPRLHRWLHTDREDLRLHRRLTDAATTWNSLHRDPDALYRGARLVAWNDRGLDRLNELERSFLAASREREAREHAFRRRRTRLALTALSIGVVLMSALTGVALIQAHRANEERDLALSRQLVAESRGQSQTDQEVALLLAELAYDTKPTPEAQSALRQAVEDFRGQAIVRPGQGQVLGVAFSPDGDDVAGTGADGTTRLWHRTGPDRLQAAPRILRGHQGNVFSPVFSPDGRRLASSGVDGTVTVWDLASGDAPVVLRGHKAEVGNIAFSADGQRVAAAGIDGTVRVWKAAGDDAPLVLRPGGALSGVAFSADGRFLAAGGDDGIWLWPASGESEPRLLRGHEGAVKNVAFSPDGQRLASVGNVDHTVRVWRTTGTEAPLVLRAQDGSIENVAFSPDGLRVAVGYSRGAVRVWSATTADDPLVLHGHDGPVWSVAFSPDGRRLASAGNDGTLRLWDPAYGGHPAVIGRHDGSAWTVAVQGHRIASGGDDGTVRVWSYPDPRPPVILRGHVGEVLAVALSPDGRRIASGGRDATLRIWDVGTGNAVVLRGHTLGVISVAFSPDGSRVASASSDGSVRIWNTDGHGDPLVLYGHEGTVRSVAFHPDGQHVASGGSDGTVRLWDLTGAHRPTVLNAHPGGLVWSLAFSPDGTHLASGGHDSTVKIWNADGSGRPLVLRGFQGIAWSVAYSPDGKQLATAGDEGGVRVWNATNGQQLADIQGHNASVEQVAFTTDESNHLVTAHGDGTLRAWECEPCRPADQVRALASTRTSRQLTGEERDLFLNQPPTAE